MWRSKESHLQICSYPVFEREEIITRLFFTYVCVAVETRWISLSDCETRQIFSSICLSEKDEGSRLCVQKRHNSWYGS
ncbi:hypothetical protein K1719_020403 [Acacia pycnantha]|nr:hypothetical protein K1719_020403 [Acacia pycnantha]